MKTVYWALRDIAEKSDELGRMVRRSGFQPDLVVGIKFGGHLIGQRVAAILQVPYAAIRITRRPFFLTAWIPHSGWSRFAFKLLEDVYYRYSRPVIMEPLVCSLRWDQTVLLVDDDIVLSKTVDLAKTHLVSRGANPQNLRVAALAVHPSLAAVPRYFLDVADVVFPWSATSPYYQQRADIDVERFAR